MSRYVSPQRARSTDERPLHQWTLALAMRDRALILPALLLAAFAINLDTTIVNVALPSLVRELHASNTQLQWIVDAYNLVFAALLLASGSLSDRVGRKGMLLAGLGVFGGASLVGGLMSTPGQLIVARCVMGLGAAMIFPATLSLISNVFTERAERAKAIGLWGATAGAAVALGPIAGGWLRSNPGAQWRDPTPHRPPPSARTQSHTPTNRNLTPRALPIKEAHMNTRPILWHIEISHYNEKARWALDLKGVEHERRALVPGYHMAVALALTRGRCYTSPILELDGRRIGDSTAIIRALEERYPQPPLYPTEPVERRRALELEDFFDEELGPYIRRLLFHDLHSDRAAAARLAAQGSPPPLKRFPRMSAEYFLAGTALRYGAGSAKAAERARRRVLRALDRLDAELGANDYLVGERFTVADLTAASLFYPLVLPAEGPVLPELPATFARFREPLKGRRGFRWVEDMFRRHRRGAPGAIAAPGS